MSESKHCRGCGNTLPATEDFFFRRADSPDGWQSRCKTCVSVRYMEYKARKKAQGDHFTQERDEMWGLVLRTVRTMNEEEQKRAAAIRRRAYEWAMR